MDKESCAAFKLCILHQVVLTQSHAAESNFFVIYKSHSAFYLAAANQIFIIIECNSSSVMV